ncbi:hypothetical protein CLV30_13339, partial [Haloactinopolyspora alba]
MDVHTLPGAASRVDVRRRDRESLTNELFKKAAGASEQERRRLVD